MSGRPVEITVVCDSPKHARGKIATVAVYHSFPDGWQRMSSFRRVKRATQQAAARRQQKARVKVHQETILSPTEFMSGYVDPRHVAPRCKLCDAELQPEVVKWLERVGLEVLASQHKQRVTITELHELRSQRKRQ